MTVAFVHRDTAGGMMRTADITRFLQRRHLITNSSRTYSEVNLGKHGR
jgi:hypothetical protein